MISEMPKVSVIIPTRNSAAFLEQCLASILDQDYPNLEIIVVDNFSTDTTVTIASRVADIVLTFGPERCAQLNEGARISTGDYLYRVDSDFTLEPGVISAAVSIAKKGADAVAIPNESDGSRGYWARVRQFERSMYRGDRTIVGARFISRASFFAIGGFDESMVAGEDYDLHNRLLKAGYVCSHCPLGEIHLGEPASLGEIIKKSFFYGTTGGQFLLKNGVRGVRQLNPFRMAYARNWKHFRAHPVLGTSFIIMQVLKYGSGAAGLLASLLSSPRSRK